LTRRIKDIEVPRKDRQPTNNVGRYRQQRFRREWQNIPEYSEWLEPVPGTDLRARCTICVREFSARLTNIQIHAPSILHRNAVALRNGVANVENERENVINRKVRRAIIKLCAVFAEHNLAFLLANHLFPVLKAISIDEDSQEIWRRLVIHRLTVPNIIKNVIASAYQLDVTTKLTNRKFGLQFDETTDVSQVHNACMIVTYVDFDLQKIVSTLWEIMNTRNEFDDDHRVNTARLYEKINSSFADKNISPRNISSFCSDGTNSMMGLNNSVRSNYERDNPGIVIVKCASHSIHLCGVYALRELPGDIIATCLSIHSHFSRSSLRQHIFIEVFSSFFKR